MGRRLEGGRRRTDSDINRREWKQRGAGPSLVPGPRGSSKEGPSLVPGPRGSSKEGYCSQSQIRTFYEQL